MAAPATQFLDLPPYSDGAGEGPPRRIAYIVRQGALDSAKPAVVWLTGLKSAMVSTKAQALDDWARTRGRTLVRLDYSGHGQSAGRFEDGRLGAWIEEARAVLATALPANAAVIVIGSSMGAHVALKLALEPSAARLAIQKLVLIAPAWDAPKALMWDRFTPEIRKTIEQTGVYMRPSRYGDGPYAITRGFIDDGLRHLLPDGPLALPCPVHILHGAEDPDVPLVHGQLLASRLAPSGVTLEVIPDGDHRLSRPQDLVRLLAAIDPVA